MIWIGLFVVSLLFTAVLVDVQTMLFLLFVYSIGMGTTLIFGGYDKKQINRTFHCVFSIGSVYMLVSYVFMSYHNYDFLLAYDVKEYFLPTTRDYMISGNYRSALESIWSNYDFFNRFQSGYFTYSSFFGFLSDYFDGNFYLGQQISVLLLFSFVGVVIYKLFKANGFSDKKAYKYTLIICFCSILFFYSSQILRDVHILLLYLLGIYLTFKKGFSFFNLLKIVLVIFLCTTFRLESGLFMIVLIPLYLFLSLQQSKKKNILIVISGLIGIGGIIVSKVYLPQVSQVVESNQEAYGGDKGDGIVGTLQKVPLVGDIASIVYNAAQPVPFWSRFSTVSRDRDDHAVYNVMNFPRSIASFFNWLVIIYVLFWLLFKKLRVETKDQISKPLLYQLLVGLVFLILQSEVISQRRLMPYYVMFYILFFIIYDNMNNKNKKELNAIVILSFIFLQVVGVVYLI